MGQNPIHVCFEVVMSVLEQGSVRLTQVWAGVPGYKAGYWSQAVKGCFVTQAPASIVNTGCFQATRNALKSKRGCTRLQKPRRPQLHVVQGPMLSRRFRMLQAPR